MSTNPDLNTYMDTNTKAKSITKKTITNTKIRLKATANTRPNTSTEANMTNDRTRNPILRCHIILIAHSDTRICGAVLFRSHGVGAANVKTNTKSFANTNKTTTNSSKSAIAPTLSTITHAQGTGEASFNHLLHCSPRRD